VYIVIVDYFVLYQNDSYAYLDCLGIMIKNETILFVGTFPMEPNAKMPSFATNAGILAF
jgi:hypothetical protein